MRDFFENGWGYAFLFGVCAALLLTAHALWAPWTQASAMLDNANSALRLEQKKSYMGWGPTRYRLQVVRAGYPIRTLLQGEDIELPLAFYTIQNKNSETWVFRSVHHEFSADALTLKSVSNWAGTEKFQGLFDTKNQNIQWIWAEELAKGELPLRFIRRGFEAPHWTQSEKIVLPQKRKRKKPTPEAAPVMQPSQLEWQQWKKDSDLLETLLRQHAPGLFGRYRSPQTRDRLGAWLDFPRSDGSSRFMAGGDFNGDGKKDYAFILPTDSAEGFGLFVLLSAAGAEYIIHRLSQGEGKPQRFLIDRVAPSIIPVKISAVSAAADPLGKGLVLQTDGLRFRRAGQWSSLFYWDPTLGRFVDLVEKE